MEIKLWQGYACFFYTGQQNKLKKDETSKKKIKREIQTKGEKEENKIQFENWF